MPEIRTAQHSLTIKPKDKLRATGTQVVETTWNPKEGFDRQTQIEQARIAAMEAHRKQLEDTSSIGVRVSRLEATIQTIRTDMDKLLQLLGQHDTNHS